MVLVHVGRAHLRDRLHRMDIPTANLLLSRLLVNRLFRPKYGAVSVSGGCKGDECAVAQLAHTVAIYRPAVSTRQISLGPRCCPLPYATASLICGTRISE